jgi:hypothetical protein
MKAIDLVGRVFGRLQVVARAVSTDHTPARPLWRCRCACGNEPIVLAAYLLAGPARRRARAARSRRRPGHRRRVRARWGATSPRGRTVIACAVG